MKTSLWSDLNAVERLARSRHAIETSSGAAAHGAPGALPEAPLDCPDGKEFDLHGVRSSGRLVTGDGFDYFFVSETTLAVTIADVSGRGMPAALLMEVTRSMIRNLSGAAGSPGATLTRINRILQQADLGSMYVTIFLAWYDPRTGLLRYANAGHPVPYRLDSSGGVSPFGRVTGPILGILDVPAYAEGSDRLEPGDRLVLFTDGVTEAEGPEEEPFGASRLEAVLVENAREPSDRLCEAVSRAVGEFQGGPFKDDATLLILRRCA